MDEARRRVDRALRAYAADLASWKSQFEAAIRASGQVLYRWTPTTGSLQWSGNVKGVTGYDVEELPIDVEAALDLVHPDDRARVRAEIDRTAAGGQLLHVTFRFRRADGAYVVVEDRGYFLTGGTERMMVGFISDVSGREGEARAVEESERKFRRIFEASVDGILISRQLDGRRLEANAELARITGYARDQLIGTRPRDLRLFSEADDERRFKDELAGSGVVRNVEAQVLRADGSVCWVLLSATIIDLEGEPCALSFVRDIEKLKRVERDLADARDQALDASRVKSAFLANMSHEIRTPLNVILGYNSLIAEELAESGERNLGATFDSIQRAGERLMRTIHGILDFSKIEAGAFDLAPRMLELAPLVERLLADFAPIAVAKGISLTGTSGPRGAQIHFDEYCLLQGLSNLLDNAIKFTDRGGVSLDVRDDRGPLCLEVRDTGIGIDPAYLNRLFEPFSQEESGYTRRFEGTGLGLALTRQYVELNGGRLEVESTKGRGTTFRIRFAPLDGAGEVDLPAAAGHRS
jgi:PAS domain S-box-containing protein